MLVQGLFSALPRETARVSPGTCAGLQTASARRGQRPHTPCAQHRGRLRSRLSLWSGELEAALRHLTLSDSVHGQPSRPVTAGHSASIALDCPPPSGGFSRPPWLHHGNLVTQMLLSMESTATTRPPRLPPWQRPMALAPPAFQIGDLL